MKNLAQVGNKMINELLKAISQKEFGSAKDMVESIIAQKIDSAIAVKKIDVAEGMFNEGKDPFAGTPWSSKKIKTKLKSQSDDIIKKIDSAYPSSSTQPKTVVKDGKRIYEGTK